ncbi:hypothetical protein ACOTCG_12975 [Achromobacter xylosoxidans]
MAATSPLSGKQHTDCVCSGLEPGICLVQLVFAAPKGNRVALPVAASGLPASAFAILDALAGNTQHNTLALQALLLAGIGLILADKKISRMSVLSWLSMATGSVQRDP